MSIQSEQEIAIDKAEARALAAELLCGRLADKLLNMCARFERCAIATGSDEEFVKSATAEHRALAESVKR